MVFRYENFFIPRDEKSSKISPWKKILPPAGLRPLGGQDFSTLGMKKFPYLKTSPFRNSIFRRENIFRLFFGKSGLFFKLLKTCIPKKEMGKMRKIWSWKLFETVSFGWVEKKSSDIKIGPWFQSYTSSEIDRPDTYSWRSKFQAYRSWQAWYNLSSNFPPFLFLPFLQH